VPEREAGEALVAGSEQARKEWLLVVVLAGVTALATSVGGLMAPASGVWLVGPVLGVGAVVAFVVFLRTRPERRLIAVAAVGLACAVLSLAVPGFLLYVFRFAGD